MITLCDVLDTLEDLESQPKSYETAEKLAVMLYLREHMTDFTPASGDKGAPAAVVEVSGDSEFMREVNGRPAADVWRIMEELMETLEVVEPRVYNGVIRRIREI